MNTFVSLFEDPSKNLWSKTRPNCSSIKIQGVLLKKNNSAANIKQGTYALCGDLLVQFNQNIYKRHIDLNNVILERVNKPHTFKLTRNKRQVEFTSNQIEFAYWYQAMRLFCIQRTFAEDYKLLKVQGEGNFAKVYRALGNDNMTYAIKCFDKKKFKNLSLERDALKLEISIMRKLNYQGILRLHEVYESDQHIWLVTDYLEGGELFSYLKNQPQGFNELQVGIWMANLLNSINSIHSQGVIHRDIKPENLIIRSLMNPSDICIADFGLAEYFNPTGKYLFKRCGTPGYVAPEILKDLNYDYKVDVFSAGIIMFIMLSGQSPFSSKSKGEIVLKNYNCDIDFNANCLQSKISLEANQLLRSLLSPDPQFRVTAQQALNSTWFMNLFTPKPQMMPMQTQQGMFALQPGLIPQFQQFPDMYARTPLMNQMLSLSMSSLSNSSNITPQRSKSNTQQVRTKSNTECSQHNEQNQFEQQHLGGIEEEESIGDAEVEINDDPIQQVRKYQINTQRKY